MNFSDIQGKSTHFQYAGYFKSSEKNCNRIKTQQLTLILLNEHSLSRLYIGDVKRDVTPDNANDGDKRQSPLYLPWPPWAMRNR
jgi:hypothetical protein